MHYSKQITIVIGVAAVAYVAWKFRGALVDQTTANARAVTSTATSGIANTKTITTTPITANKIAFASPPTLVKLGQNFARAAQSALSSIIPARTDALQPNGSPQVQAAALAAKTSPAFKPTPYADLQKRFR